MNRKGVWHGHKRGTLGDGCQREANVDHPEDVKELCAILWTLHDPGREYGTTQILYRNRHPRRNLCIRRIGHLKRDHVFVQCGKIIPAAELHGKAIARVVPRDGAKEGGIYTQGVSNHGIP